MLAKLKRLLDLFRKGERLTDANVWKVENGLMLVGLLTAFFVSLDEFAKATGYNFGMTDTEIEGIARWIVSTFGVITTIVVPMISRRVGLPAKKDPPNNEELIP